MDKKGTLSNIIDFSGLKITLASSTTIKEWSYGEITKPETINYRTLKPEKDGLFDERIFGPTKDWECYCGKYKRIRYRGIICDKCGVEVTQSKVRRERMGHINLAAPVAHVWFFKGAPSKLSLLLDMTPRSLESVIYFAQYLVLDVDEDKRKEILTTFDKRVEEKHKEIITALDRSKKDLQGEFAAERRALKDRIKSPEAREVALSEINLKEKQRLAHLDEDAAKEEEKAKEMLTTLTTLIKSIKKLTLLTEDEYLKLLEYKAAGFFTVGMGAEAVLNVIKTLDLDKLAAQMREEAQKTKGQRHIKATKRLRVVEGLKNAQINPTWMILTILPVIPPDLRPMVQLPGSQFPKPSSPIVLSSWLLPAR